MSINKKDILTYDCFYHGYRENHRTKKILDNIIILVNDTINNLTSRTSRTSRISRISRISRTSRTSITSRTKEINILIEKYNDYKMKSNQYEYIEIIKKNYNYKKNKILDTYSNFNKYKDEYIKNEKLLEYLSMLKPTENGIGTIPIIYNKDFNASNINTLSKLKKHISKSSKSSKIFIGGESLSYTNQIFLPALQEFCHYAQNIGTFNNLSDIRLILQQLYTVHQSHNFIALYNFIINNYDEIIYTYSINFHSYNLNDYDNIRKLGDESFTRRSKCREYNKEIVMSYEIYQHYYKDYLQQYINLQIAYIESLSNIDKHIIKDYTRPRTFNFLNSYISDPSPGWIRRYLIKWQLTSISSRLSNSFWYIISTLFPGQNINTYKNKTFYENADPFYDTITEDNWELILQIYLVEINRIVLGAPATTNNIFCFRGSSSDYIMPTNTYTDHNGVIDVFLSSSRPASISFNFDASLSFYNEGSSHNKTMYRILVTPGCKLLFASPLTDDSLRYEMEFIVPLHHVFASMNMFANVEAYNSFENENNICLNNIDKLNSKDIVLLPI